MCLSSLPGALAQNEHRNLENSLLLNLLADFHRFIDSFIINCAEVPCFRIQNLGTVVQGRNGVEVEVGREMPEEG